MTTVSYLAEQTRKKKLREQKKDDNILASYSPDPTLPQLKPDERLQCDAVHKTFSMKPDHDALNAWGLRLALEAMGYHPTDQDIEKAVATYGKKGMIYLPVFPFVVQLQKRNEKSPKKDAELVEAFAAMNPVSEGKSGDPKAGKISVAALQKVLRDDFNMTIKVEELILASERDDQSADIKEIDFAKFAYIFGQ